MKQLIFWGTPAFAVPPLRELHDCGLIRCVITQPDKPQGRGQSQLPPSPVKEAATNLNLPVLQPSQFDASFEAALGEFLPATFLVVAYGKLIPNAVLMRSALPAINIHPSLLPELRGPSPIQTALLRGDRLTGLTLMQLDEELDHGSILAQKKVSIAPTDTYLTLSEKLSLSATQFVRTYVPAYLHGELKPVQQDHSHATFSKKIETKDTELRLEKTADELLNMIRAFNPKPGTFLVIGGKRFKIMSARRYTAPPVPAATLFRSEHGYLGIVCDPEKREAIEVILIQPEGRPAMNAMDFLNGYSGILG